MLSTSFTSKLCSGFKNSQVKKKNEAVNMCRTSIGDKYPSAKAATLLSVIPKRKDGIPTNQIPLLNLNIDRARSNSIEGRFFSVLISSSLIRFIDIVIQKVIQKIDNN
jgi:hypothetical protein